MMCEIYDDGDGYSVSKTEHRKARKTHHCYACGSVIEPGDRYRYTSSIYDHHPSSEKVCAACDVDIDAFGKAHNYWPAAEYFEGRLVECIADGDAESEAKWKPMLERFRAREAAAERAA